MQKEDLSPHNTIDHYLFSLDSSFNQSFNFLFEAPPLPVINRGMPKQCSEESAGMQM